MRLQCEVEVVNRMLPSFGLKGKGRSCRALLSIGKQVERSGASLCLLICTARDRSGAKYKLKENIEKFFTGFVEEGKATVRLKEPAVDICLSKADVPGLKSFLSVARLAHRGRDSEALPALSTLCPVRARDVEKPKKKMSVLSRKDYPLSSGFPGSLEQLQVSYCRLSRVDTRVLALRALRRLDLSNNHISALPAALAELSRLAELVLHSNRLQRLSEELCSAPLQSSLRLLDLSHNRLSALPARFCQLRQLVTLKLDHNQLRRLPFHVGRLSELRFLSAAHNRLTQLPGDFLRLSLESLDLFGNPFSAQEPRLLLTLPLTLQELASRAVLELRIPYCPGALPAHLCVQLDSCSRCGCGRVCVDSFIQSAVSINLHCVSHTVVLVDDMGGTEAPVQTRFCSLTCFCQHMDTCV